jgi:hypothetical protein
METKGKLPMRNQNQIDYEEARDELTAAERAVAAAREKFNRLGAAGGPRLLATGDEFSIAEGGRAVFVAGVLGNGNIRFWSDFALHKAGGGLIVDLPSEFAGNFRAWAQGGLE